MIKAVFKQDSAQVIRYFRITGHADSGPYGSDIVCAAVSAVTIGALNSIEALAGFEPKVTLDEENGGHIEFWLNENLPQVQFDKAQLLLASLQLSLQDIAQTYAKYLTVTINESVTPS
jgi:uncharacterized protein YsxB (DUF464 family)